MSQHHHERWVGRSRISVGAYTYQSEFLTIKQWDEGANLTIGSFCSLSETITVMLGGNHRVEWITTYPFGLVHKDVFNGGHIQGHPATKGDVVIGNDVWIGHNVTIMSGVSIGHGAVIATGSIVTKDVGPYEIVGGNPAKHIKYRFSQEIIDLLLKLSWWDLPVNQIREIVTILSTEPTVDVVENLIKQYRP